jgi:hypothetical protein
MPCSSSTFIPIWNRSRLNGEASQSTPIRSPAARAWSREKRACELMLLTLNASPPPMNQAHPAPLDLVEIGLMSAEEARELHEMETAAAAS